MVPYWGTKSFMKTANPPPHIKKTRSPIWGTPTPDSVYPHIVDEDEQNALRYTAGYVFLSLEDKDDQYLTSYDLLMALRTGWRVTEWKHGVFFKCTEVFEPVIRELYATRRALKSRGDPAETIYKLQMNSFYGKMAQNDRSVMLFGSRDDLEQMEDALPHTLQQVSRDGRSWRIRLKRVKSFVTPMQLGVHTSSFGRFFMHWLESIVGAFEMDAPPSMPVLKLLDPKNADMPVVRIYYQDTDSNYVNMHTFRLWEGMGCVGRDLGQLKLDTGSGTDGAYVMAGVFCQRKSYCLIVWTGSEIAFKVRMKGVRRGLEYNPMMR